METDAHLTASFRLGRALHFPVRPWALRPSALLLALFGSLLPSMRAVVPAAAENDPLYAKGYLVVTHYPGVSNHNDETTAAATTAGLNEALADAYAKNLVAYFPAGTYFVNDTLKAHTATGLPATEPGYTHATPRNSLAVIGATTGASRPLIKLAPGAGGFSDPGSPKTLLEFMNFNDEAHLGIKASEKESEGYNQMLRGVNLDCSGYAGAIGLYFNQAQGGSIEDVGIVANGAFAGIKALPGRGCVVVNIMIEGGQYGIDTLSTGAAGTVINGAVFLNQTVSAVRYDGFVPLVIAGFEIVTPAGSPQAALTIQPNAKANSSCINLLDGIITLGAEPTVAAIDNPAGQSFYARNVYVTGGAKLVRSGSNSALSGTGTWQLIEEYSFCDQAAPDSDGKASWDLIDGLLTKTPGPLQHGLGNGEVVSVNPDAPAPPAGLATRHAWKSLPSVTDSDAFDAFAAGIVPDTNVSSAALQTVINRHQKVFLRKGIYYLDGPVTLGRDSILFGAARHLTRIEVQSGWKPTSETPIISTVNDATATTYIGGLSIGVNATDLANDWFVALDWQAGRNSVVHIGRVYREPAATVPLNRWETNPHSLLRIRNSGGGRWYHSGSGKTLTSEHAGFRILKVEGTTEPLWLYGLNAEHPRGCDTYVEITNASNVRLYGMKTEFNGVAFWEDRSVLITYHDVVNVAQFGHGAIRNAVDGKGTIEFRGAGTDRVLATLIAPQNDLGNAVGDTLRENLGPGNAGVLYPNVVALYKRGAISPADEAAMNHAGISYGQPSTGNAAPAVTLTAPAAGATLALAATPVSAIATDPDGTVSVVKFYVNGTLVGSDATTPYTVSWTPPAAGSYTLTATATDNAGADGVSAPVSVTVIGAAPAAPAGLTATAGAGQVSLTWTASSGATNYLVKRSNSSGGPYAPVGSSVTASFTDLGLNSDTTYFYVVSAVNVAGESANSTEAGATPVSPPNAEAIFTSIGAEDGYVLESTPTSNLGGSILSNGTGGQATRVGDDTSARQYKSIFSFDTSTLPSGAVIVGATLELRRSTLAGNAAAVALFSPLFADIRQGSFGTSALEITDFEAPATATNVTTLSFPAANNAWSIGALNPAGLAAINPAGRTQFRVAFTVPDNGNATTDLLGFFPGESDLASRPILRISYSLPPAITAGPVSQTVTAGGNAFFQVTVTGSGPLVYQWRRNGVALADNPTARSGNLVLANVTTALAGGYDCVITNPVGSVTSAAASLTVLKAAASITLGELSQTFDGTPRAVNATTVPAGLGVILAYDMSASAPTNAGTYAVTATISDPNYTGSATGTLVVAKAQATITLAPLAQTYDGTPRVVSATTTPAGLTAAVTYNGSPGAPTNAGTYTLAATVNDSNYNGSVTGTLSVGKASATVTLAPLTQSYDGTPRIVTAATAPAGLTVSITYDDDTTAPVAPGTYAVSASVDETNHTGTTSGTLRVTTTAMVRHAPSLNGGLDGSVQVLSGENVTLNGNAWVSGDLLLPGTPSVRLNGHPNFGGTIDGPGSASPSGYQLTLNGNAILRHLVRRTDPRTLPTVSAPPAPAGTRSVSLQSAGQDIGDFATLRNLTLNGNAGDYAIPAGTYGTFTANGQSGFILGQPGATTPDVYFLQGLKLNGGTRLQLLGPVILVLASGVSLNGDVNSTGPADWLSLAVATGGVTLNGNVTLNGSVLAPSGTVTINGQATLTGSVVSDRLTINGDGLLEQETP